MKHKTNISIGLISSLVLSFYGAYHIMDKTSEANWMSGLLAVSGFIGFLGGIWELRKFNAAEK